MIVRRRDAVLAIDARSRAVYGAKGWLEGQGGKSERIALRT